MKYGETLRQRSIPAWSHHNIDYDDIKRLIKDSTTPGKGKTVSVPGRGDDKLLEFENNLFLILADQHERIDLFVKSKAGEIQRRLDHSKKQLRQLAARQTSIADHRIPVGRLERYGRLENDVIKAGDEIKSLARFTATQRTAFRKLLKKYKKWTGSADLEDRFRDEVLDDPKSFTKLDLGPLLDDYSITQLSIRTLYETQMQQSSGGRPEPGSKATSSAIRRLQDAIERGSKVMFDTEIETVPLGENGCFASYFVHPESVIELQMLLLHYARFYQARSRSNSVATPVSPGPNSEPFAQGRTDIADYNTLVADSLDRFVKEQSALTVDDREHSPGIFPQRARASVRCNNEENALACLRSSSGKTKSAFLKRKYIQDFFDTTVKFSPKQEAFVADTAENVQELRQELLREDIKPLYQFSSCRSRLVGLDDGPKGVVLATLDTNITIEKASTTQQQMHKSTFPFGLLLVRQEGTPKSELLSALENSHLVERVRGFSLEHHCIWETHHPTDIPAPFWLPILSRDIRKLPPPVMKRPSMAGAGNGSGTQSAGSNGSAGRVTDSTTAVETTHEIASQFETPPLKSFRKKKRRTRTHREESSAAKQSYWSEYDHPEDGEDDPNAFFVFVDPNEKNSFDRFFEKLGALFSRNKGEEDRLSTSPGTPKDDESSSDDETEAAPLNHSTHSKSFGTFGTASASSAAQHSRRERRQHFLSQFTVTCFAASLAILVVAWLLRITGRHKYLRSEHFGVLFSIICSLAFVLIGFMSLLRTRTETQPISLGAWTASVVVLIVDVLGCGGLLAWLFG